MYAICFAAMLRLKQLQPILWQCAKQPFSTSQPGPEVIQITPRVSLFDQDVHVKVQGLPSQSKVTLHASTELEWQRKPVQFVACSHHITGLTGEVDLMTDASLGGSYTGLCIGWSLYLENGFSFPLIAPLQLLITEAYSVCPSVAGHKVY